MHLAQRLDPTTKRPVDRRSAVYHRHQTTRRLSHVVGRVGMAVDREKIVFALEEMRGNVWMRDLRVTAVTGIVWVGRLLWCRLPHRRWSHRPIRPRPRHLPAAVADHIRTLTSIKLGCDPGSIALPRIALRVIESVPMQMSSERKR